jgi:hypothetical protein
MFRLINSETVPLTPDLAQQFRTLTPSPTERPFDESRAKMLRTAAENGKLVAFNWAQATFSGKTIRMNGQHSSSVLCELSGAFPQGLKVHLDTYQVDDKEGLADLFRQFDSRKSGRAPGDVAGAYQGLHDELRDVPRASAKLAVEGAAWFDRHVEGLPVGTDDDVWRFLAVASSMRISTRQRCLMPS